MRAALLDQLGCPLRVGEAPKPVPQPDEVLVQVEACGVCHSDLHMAQGDWPDVAKRMKFPAVLGHEVVGRVVEAGREARGVAVGDRVGVGWLRWTCGACEYCSSGHENICLEREVTGVESPGGFAEFLPIKASHAVRIPEKVSSEEAAPLFCAGLTVYHAFRNANIRGGRVAVFGVGGLGHLALQLARNLGAEVIAVDVSEGKLEMARALGAKVTINSNDPGARKQLRAGGGPDAAVVTAASKPAYDLAFKTLKRRGTLAVVGLPKEDLTFFADDLVVGEFHIVGSAVGTREEMHELLAMAAAGKVRCEVEAHPLDAINDIFDRMRGGTLRARAVLVPR